MNSQLPASFRSLSETLWHPHIIAPPFLVDASGAEPNSTHYRLQSLSNCATVVNGLTLDEAWIMATACSPGFYGTIFNTEDIATHFQLEGKDVHTRAGRIGEALCFLTNTIDLLVRPKLRRRGLYTQNFFGNSDLSTINAILRERAA